MAEAEIQILFYIVKIGKTVKENMLARKKEVTKSDMLKLKKEKKLEIN